MLNKVYLAIEKNETRLAESERKQSTKGEWQHVALVCDRFLFAVFFFSTTVATLVVLTSSPHMPFR